MNILCTVAKMPTGELIKANVAEKGQPYICPVCSSSLILRKGEKKRPHFAHKSLSFNCSPETALHYIFKNLLYKKIQEHIESNLPLGIEWDCKYCGGSHTGNLLKKAIRVELEYQLDNCRPDIALLECGSNWSYRDYFACHRRRLY